MSHSCSRDWRRCLIVGVGWGWDWSLHIVHDAIHRGPVNVAHDAATAFRQIVAYRLASFSLKMNESKCDNVWIGSKR